MKRSQLLKERKRSRSAYSPTFDPPAAAHHLSTHQQWPISPKEKHCQPSNLEKEALHQQKERTKPGKENRSPPPSIVASVTAATPDVPLVPAVGATPATLSARGGRGKGRSLVGIHIQEQTTPPPSIAAPATTATLDVPVVPAVGATPATLSVRGGRGKGPSSGGIHIQEQTTPPPFIATPATAAMPDVPVMPTVGATSATLSARGGRGKGPSSGGIHIQEQTTPPPSIGIAASAPVFTPTTAMGFTTPIAPAHASASAMSDPISSSIGEIRVSPGS
ncbi:hypothetical protein Drorol1_Dr00012073 [Drosera rotundifolia]